MNWPETDDHTTLIADGRHASAVDRPTSLDELGDALRGRAAEGFAIYPRGGGTTLHHGGTPATPGAFVDTTGLARVIDYPAADMTITVEAGMTLDRLRAVLDAEGQRLLLDAPDPDRATLGGIFATATCGPRRFGWGRPRDQILGVAFADSDGRIIRGGGRVVKNVAGYDLPKLLTGSFGTLGVISELTLKVRPRAEATAIALLALDHAEALGQALDALNTSSTRPVAIDVLNRPAAKLVLKDSPFEGDSPFVLVVGFEDGRAAVSWQVDALREELGPIEAIEGRDAERLWERLVAFQTAEPGPLSCRAGIRKSLMPALIGSIDPERWAMEAHAGSGILHLHALGDPTLDEIAPRVDRLRQAANLGGGFLVVPRGPAEWKARLKVWGDPRPDWALGDRVKRALDPAGRMNPGRFVGTMG